VYINPKQPMINWLKAKLDKNPFIFVTTLIFTLTVAMIGSSSHGVRNFIQNIAEITLVSFIGVFVLAVLATSNLKSEEEKRFPFLLFWAVIAFTLTFARW